MIIDWEELFKQDNTVFHCEIEDIAIEFLSIAHNLDYEWRNGDSYLHKNEWSFYKEETCYNIKNGTFADVEYFINEMGYKIINISELLYGRKPFKLKRK